MILKKCVKLFCLIIISHTRWKINFWHSEDISQERSFYNYNVQVIGYLKEHKH